MLTLSQIRFCALECKRQQSGEESVADMCSAFHYAFDDGKITAPISLSFIKELGQIVEPKKNVYGFRTVPVYFGDPTKQAVNPDQIITALSSLINNGYTLTALNWYVEFEKIHPFLDGNGRVGAILYNIKNRTMKNPVIPPDMF